MNIDTTDLQKIIDKLPEDDLKTTWQATIDDTIENETVNTIRLQLIYSLANPDGVAVPTTLEELQKVLTDVNNQVTTAISNRPPKPPKL